MFGKKVLFMIVVCLVVACGGATAEPMEDFAYAGESDGLNKVAQEMPAFDTDTSLIGNTATAAQPALPQQPLIIRTGNLDLIVADTDETVQAITQQVGAVEGWVVNTNLYQSGDFRRGDISVRVPVTEFSNMMAQFKTLAIEVRSESSNGQDVTEEFVDVTARLANMEATAERVRGFLAETRNVEEALAVNVELSRLEGEIESLKGRQQYLSQSAAFSTIQITLTPDAASQPIEIAGWQPQGVAKDAIEALASALQGIANFLIWFVLFALPVLLVVGLPLYFIGRFVWRRVRGRRVPVTSEES
jgi:hypothetical protein